MRGELCGIKKSYISLVLLTIFLSLKLVDKEFIKASWISFKLSVSASALPQLSLSDICPFILISGNLLDTPQFHFALVVH